MVKRGSNNLGRDDVAAALVLAAGSLARHGSMEPAKVLLILIELDTNSGTSTNSGTTVV